MVVVEAVECLGVVVVVEAFTLSVVVVVSTWLVFVFRPMTKPQENV